MDIEALSMAMSMSQTVSDVSTAVLSKNLDALETMGTNMTKMMEQSVTPELGQAIDVTL